MASWYFKKSDDNQEVIHSECGFDVIVFREPITGDYVAFSCVFYSKKRGELYLSNGDFNLEFRVYGNASNGLTKVNKEGREYFLDHFKGFLGRYKEENPFEFQSESQAKQSKDNP